MHLSKSKYCAFWQCPKMAWLNKYKPEERIIDESITARMEAGTGVLSAMLLRTQEEMSRETPVICEAAFVYEGLYGAVTS